MNKKAQIGDFLSTFTTTIALVLILVIFILIVGFTNKTSTTDSDAQISINNGYKGLFEFYNELKNENSLINCSDYSYIVFSKGGRNGYLYVVLKIIDDYYVSIISITQDETEYDDFEELNFNLNNLVWKKTEDRSNLTLSEVLNAIKSYGEWNTDEDSILNNEFLTLSKKIDKLSEMESIYLVWEESYVC